MLQVKKILALVLPLAACSTPRDVPVEADAGVTSPRSVTGNSGGTGGIIAGCLAAMIAVGCGGGDGSTTETLSDGGPQTMMKDASGKDAHMTVNTPTNDSGSNPTIIDSGALAPDAKASGGQDGAPVQYSLPSAAEVLTLLMGIGVPERVMFVSTVGNRMEVYSTNYVIPLNQPCRIGIQPQTAGSPQRAYRWEVNGSTGAWIQVDAPVVAATLLLERDVSRLKIATNDLEFAWAGKYPYSQLPPLSVEAWILENKAALNGKSGVDLDTALRSLVKTFCRWP